MGNRVVKFRGKRIDNGEWVFGSYVKSANDRAYIIIYATEDAVNTGNELDFLYIEIIPETIGQYTGLKDKNDVEIYEGDIVREQGNDYTPIYQNGVYMAYNVDKINDPYVSTQFNVIWRNGCEVIGNIHDQEETT